MKKLLACLFMLLWAFYTPTLAQSPDDLRLVVGQPKLFFVPPDGQVDLNFSALDGPMYLVLRANPETSISGGLFHSDISPVNEVAYIPYDSQTTVLEVSNATQGDYILVAGAFGKGGYVRIEYRISPLDQLDADERIFTGDPLSIAFYESFTDNNRGWWTGQADNISVAIENDSLAFDVQGSGRALTGFDALPGAHQNYYVLQATLRNAPTTDAAIGLVVRLVDARNFYVFQISPEQNAGRFLALQEGEWSELVGWSPLPPYEESYRLQVLVLGDTYVLLMNDTPIGHVQDSRFTGGGAGIYVELPPDSLAEQGQTIFVDELLIGVPPQGATWPVPILPTNSIQSPAEPIGTEDAP